MFELKEFQKNTINKLKDLIFNGKKEIVLQAPTGAGKTVILDKTIEEIFNLSNKNIVFVWFTPGNGELEEQSRNSFCKYVKEYKSKNLDEAIRQGINNKEVIFINWEQVNNKDKKALREQEKKNLKNRIKECLNKNYHFVLVVDESHKNFTNKSKEVMDLFSNAQRIYISATINKKKMSNIDIEIPEETVIRSGLITRFININEGINKKSTISTYEEEFLLDLAIEKQQEIKKEYSKIGVDINPLIIIQYPNESTNNKYAKSSAELLERVDTYLNKKAYSYDNKMVACWLAGNKKNIENDNQPMKDVIFLHTKQALAIGWDCPRAKILVKLRDNMNETFEIQVLGRIRRMPEHKHYENPILDNCYLYTLDEKYKQEAISNFGGKETKILYIKEKYNNKNLNLGLKKEIKSLETSMIDDKEQCEILYNYIIKKYNLEEVLKSNKDKSGYRRNLNKLEKLNENEEGYVFDEMIEINTFVGKTTQEDLKNKIANTNIKENVSNEILYEKQKNTTWVIASSLGLSDKIIRTTLQKLFLKEKISKKQKRNYSGGVLGLSKRDFWIFIINNIDQLKKDFKEAKYDSYSQINLELGNIKEFDFLIPEKDIVYLDKSIKTPKELNLNVYDDYTNDIEHSTPEKRFEHYCQNSDIIEWFYKNGDKGQNYLSIVYGDSFKTQSLFYPDYIIKVNGKIYIIEVKGGNNSDGTSKNIDKDKVQLKLECLKSYVEKHNKKNPNTCIDYAFVKDVDIEDDLGKIDYKLYYTKTKWSEDINEEYWHLLNELFENNN